jgi:hypothetical protein
LKATYQNGQRLAESSLIGVAFKQRSLAGRAARSQSHEKDQDSALRGPGFAHWRERPHAASITKE